MTHASRLTPSPFLVIAFFAATAAVAQPVPIDLGALGGTSSTPAAINDSGQVVGGSKVASGDAHAFVSTPASGMMDLARCSRQVIARRRRRAARAWHRRSTILATSQ